jgi:predicted PurR-regulated permease PerM
VFLVVLAVVVAGLAVIGFVGASLRQLAGELPRYQAQLEALLQTLSARFASRGINAADYVQQALTGEVIGRFALRSTSAIAASVSNTVLILVIFAFMLGGMWEMERRAGADAADHSPLAARFLAFSATMRGYMGVRAVLGFVAALADYVLLLAVGVEYAALWGLLSFIMSFVPNIGFVLSMIPPALLALVGLGWPSALVVVAGYLVINALVDNVVGPRFIGRQMRISALLSFVSVLFWAWVLGPTGALVAVPLTVLIRDLVSEPGGTPDVGRPAPVTPSTLATPAPAASGDVPA